MQYPQRTHFPSSGSARNFGSGKLRREITGAPILAVLCGNEPERAGRTPTDAGAAALAVLLDVELSLRQKELFPVPVVEGSLPEQAQIRVHFGIGLHPHGDRVNEGLREGEPQGLFRRDGEMSASEGLHREDPHAPGFQFRKGRGHIPLPAVRDADPGHVVEGMADVSLDPGVGEFQKAPDQGDVVGGGSDGPDDPPLPQIEQGVEGFPVSPQGIGALLLVEEEDVDHVPVQLPPRLVHRFEGQFAVPGVGFRGDEDGIGVLRPSESGPDQRIVRVILGGVDEIDPRIEGVGHHRRGLVRRQVPLHGRDGQGSEGDPRNGGQAGREDGFRDGGKLRSQGIPSEGRPSARPGRCGGSARGRSCSW